MSLTRLERALWTCPQCRRTFANRNQSHSCGTVGTLDAHFAGKPAFVRALFDRLLAVVEDQGPVVVLPERSRIAFHVRMSFMMVMVRRSGLRGHFVLPAVQRHSRFTKVTTYSPRNHVHEFRLRSESQIDRTFKSWVAQAYRVGEQRHLRRS